MPKEKPTHQQIENLYAYHPPKGDQVSRYAAIRANIQETAKFIRDNTPASREQERSLESLHNAMMQANAAIACNEH